MDLGDWSERHKSNSARNFMNVQEEFHLESGRFFTLEPSRITEGSFPVLPSDGRISALKEDEELAREDEEAQEIFSQQLKITDAPSDTVVPQPNKGKRRMPKKAKKGRRPRISDSRDKVSEHTRSFMEAPHSVGDEKQSGPEEEEQ